MGWIKEDIKRRGLEKPRCGFMSQWRWRGLCQQRPCCKPLPNISEHFRTVSVTTSEHVRSKVRDVSTWTNRKTLDSLKTSWVSSVRTLDMLFLLHQFSIPKDPNSVKYRIYIFLLYIRYPPSPLKWIQGRKLFLQRRPRHEAARILQKLGRHQNKITNSWAGRLRNRNPPPLHLYCPCVILSFHAFSIQLQKQTIVLRFSMMQVLASSLLEMMPNLDNPLNS